MFSTYYFTEANAFRRKLENMRFMIFWNVIRIAWSLWEGNDVLPVKIYILTAVFQMIQNPPFISETTMY